MELNRCAKGKKYGPNERTDQSSRKSTLNDSVEIANLSDAEFKTLITRMLTEMVEYSRKIEEEVKSTRSEINKNIQGTNSERKETGNQIKYLEQKEVTNIKPEQNEETRIQKKKKNEKQLRNLWDNFKCSNIQIIWVPEGEE